MKFLIIQVEIAWCSWLHMFQTTAKLFGCFTHFLWWHIFCTFEIFGSLNVSGNIKMTPSLKSNKCVFFGRAVSIWTEKNHTMRCESKNDFESCRTTLAMSPPKRVFSYLSNWLRKSSWSEKTFYTSLTDVACCLALTFKHIKTLRSVFTFLTKKIWAVCNCCVATRVGALERSMLVEHFQLLLYGPTTSRKFSTG